MISDSLRSGLAALKSTSLAVLPCGELPTGLKGFPTVVLKAVKLKGPAVPPITDVFCSDSISSFSLWLAAALEVDDAARFFRLRDLAALPCIGLPIFRVLNNLLVSFSRMWRVAKWGFAEFCGRETGAEVGRKVFAMLACFLACDLLEGEECGLLEPSAAPLFTGLADWGLADWGIVDRGLADWGLAD